MAAEPEQQHVLLTEGVQGETDETSGNDEIKDLPLEETSETANVNLPVTSAVKDEELDAELESSGPVTAPEASSSVDDSLKNVERSMISALSVTQNGEDNKGGGGDDEMQESLIAKLDQIPSEAGDGDEEEYVAPPEDPYMRAVNYMERHKVMQIFQKLTAEIVYHRPPDPLEHMLTELQKMKKERDAMMDDIISSASSKAGSEK